MSETRDLYRVWCEQCDWEDEIRGEEAASKLIHLGHGVPTGHHETYQERVDDE